MRNVEGSAPRRMDAAAFVVVNWNQSDLTSRCVRALMDDGAPPERIVIVDNGSHDDSVEHLAANHPSSVHVALPENVGYARAANEGARTLPSEVYAFVNNDAFVHRPGSTALLVETATTDHIGVAVPRLLNEDLSLQRSVVPLTSPANALVRATGLSRFIPNHWQPDWSTHWDHTYSRDIQCVAGAVMVVRGELWDQVGGFTSKTAMYGDELHLFWRARELGWRARFVAEAEFVHLGNASASQQWTSTDRAEAMGTAEAVALRHLMPPNRARLTVAFIAAGLIARLPVFAALRNRPAVAGIRAYLRGQWRGLSADVTT
jgi:N-acetylglucosaminyl-diphospho-decaprenol L-rhamnosyltransferase